jgi:hypothetical protein
MVFHGVLLVVGRRLSAADERKTPLLSRLIHDRENIFQIY